MLTQESNIVVAAEKVKNKYLYDIDSCINPNEVLRAKFFNDKAYWKHICDLLYKKIK